MVTTYTPPKPALSSVLAGTTGVKVPAPPPKPLVSSVTSASPGGGAVTASPTPTTFNLTQGVKGPRTNALASALIQQAQGPKRSLFEALGGIALVGAGQQAQKRYEQSETEREALPAKQIQEFVAQGGDFGNADALIATGTPWGVEQGMKIKQAQIEAGLKPPSVHNVEGVGLVEQRPGGEYPVVVPAQPEGVIPMSPEMLKAYPNLDPTAQWGWDTKKNTPVKLSEGRTPTTEIGKIQQAYNSGEFGKPGTPQADGLFAATMEAEQRKLQGYTTLSPEERLLWGISPTDKSVWMKSPEGKPERIESPAQYTDMPPDKDGNIFQRNDLTNELKLVKAGTKAPTLPAGYRWKDEAKGIAEGIPGVPPKSELTETQSKMLFYYGRGVRANEDLKTLDTQLTSLPDRFWEHVPTGNFQIDEKYQLARAAANEFLVMMLRPDTGAAVTDTEFAIYAPTYLPMPGDTPATVEKKRQMRAWAMYTLKGTLGNAKPLADQFDEDLLGMPSPSMSPVNPASPSGTLAIPETLPAPGPDGLIHLPDGRVMRPSGG